MRREDKTCLSLQSRELNTCFHSCVLKYVIVFRVSRVTLPQTASDRLDFNTEVK